MPTTSRPRPVISPWLLVPLLGLTFTAIVAGQGPARSVRDGVYTSSQAQRGNQIYSEKCAACHATRMWGSDWTEKSLWDVYDIISNYMPQDDPGSLSPRQSRDLLAYILNAKQLPAGPTELPESDDDLRQIRIDLPSQ